MMILMIIAMMIVLAIVEDQAVLEVLVAALNYSGSNDYSNGSSSGGNNGIPSIANYGWIEGSDGNRIENYYDPSTGDTWDMDGNYSGNMNDWLWD